MDSEDIKRSRELIEALKRRKHQRELQLAQQGINADPIIRTEIEDISKWIFRLQQEITQASLDLSKSDQAKPFPHDNPQDKMKIPYTAPTKLQIASHESAIRNQMWNKLIQLRFLGQDPLIDYERLWKYYFKLPVDSIPMTTTRMTSNQKVFYVKNTQEIIRLLRNYFFSCNMTELYHFILFILNEKKGKPVSSIFIQEINEVLNHEGAKYRYQDIDYTDKQARNRKEEIKLTYLE